MLRLYIDHHVHAGITRELRARGVDVVTAYEDNHHEVDDATLLDRAHALGRLLFSQDEDLLRERVSGQLPGRKPVRGRCLCTPERPHRPDYYRSGAHRSGGKGRGCLE